MNWSTIECEKQSEERIEENFETETESKKIVQNAKLTSSLLVIFIKSTVNKFYFFVHVFYF